MKDDVVKEERLPVDVGPAVALTAVVVRVASAVVGLVTVLPAEKTWPHRSVQLVEAVAGPRHMDEDMPVPFDPA